MRSIINNIEVEPLIAKSSNSIKKDLNNVLIYDAVTIANALMKKCVKRLMMHAP